MCGGRKENLQEGSDALPHVFPNFPIIVAKTAARVTWGLSRNLRGLFRFGFVVKD
jgi:hypothetical protein